MYFDQEYLFFKERWCLLIVVSQSSNFFVNDIYIIYIFSLNFKGSKYFWGLKVKENSGLFQIILFFFFQTPRFSKYFFHGLIILKCFLRTKKWFEHFFLQIIAYISRDQMLLKNLFHRIKSPANLYSSRISY